MLTRAALKCGEGSAMVVILSSQNATQPGMTDARRVGILSRLQQAFNRAWSRETSFDPLNWSDQNAAWGQCAVTALIVQDHCGGRLMTGEINGVPHYWNRISGNRDLDLTEHQFGRILSRSGTRECDREYVLSYPQTARRYRKLRTKVAEALETV
jgi:hypothetical protein